MFVPGLGMVVVAWAGKQFIFICRFGRTAVEINTMNTLLAQNTFISLITALLDTINTLNGHMFFCHMRF